MMSEPFRQMVIVGGGISGILLALKVSHQHPGEASSLALLDENPTLGGRLFSSSLKKRVSDADEILQNLRGNKGVSGFGWEGFSAATLDAYYRHICNYLNDDEKNFLDDFWIPASTDGESSVRTPHTFFVKKECTSASELLSGSSEVLTKREAEILNSFVNQTVLEGKEQEAKLPFAETKFFSSLSKALQEALFPLFESCIGFYWKELTFERVCQELSQFFNKKEPVFDVFKRKNALEIALEKILLTRGVDVRTLCAVTGLQKNAQSGYTLHISSEKNLSDRTLTTKKVVFAMPLFATKGLLAKEHYLPEQSRFVAKCPPLSMVVLELSRFSEIKSSLLPDTLMVGDVCVFPTERIRAFHTSTGSLLLYSVLDYESSLEATAVKAAVARMRRAAARIVKDDISAVWSKGVVRPQLGQIMAERILMLPIAHSYPLLPPPNTELKQTKLAAKNLFCCGDAFSIFGNEPWKAVVGSVDEVAPFFVL